MAITLDETLILANAGITLPTTNIEANVGVFKPFKRRLYSVTVAGARLPDGLTISFDIEKSRKHQPNSCRLQIWNLSKSSREFIQSLSLNAKQNTKGTGKGSFKQVGVQSGDIRVEVEAGYEEVGASLIFRGDLRTASSERQRTEIITTLWGEDGGSSSLTARVSASFAPGTTMETVAKFCAARMGVGAGNLAAVFNGGLPGLNSPIFNVYEEGYSIHGSAGDELKGILSELGVTFSIQDGVIQCTTPKGYIPTSVVVLAPSTGLVGSPVKDMNGFVRATCLIQPNLFVGGRVLFDTEDFQGQYVILSINYQGESKGQAWYAKIECR